jgi:hypothetical protein
LVNDWIYIKGLKESSVCTEIFAQKKPLHLECRGSTQKEICMAPLILSFEALKKGKGVVSNPAGFNCRLFPPTAGFIKWAKVFLLQGGYTPAKELNWQPPPLFALQSVI